MSEHSNDYIAALAETYRLDPTPENAQRLWDAVFKLEGWYVILRGGDSDPVPYCGSYDGKSFIAVWTDPETLNAYIDEAGLEPDADGEIRYMLIPLPHALDYVLSFQEQGLDAVRFNPAKGWAVSFGTLRNVGRLF